jgi:hypothetical protein
MLVYLLCFNDMTQTELIGLFVFPNFTSLIKRSNFFFNYNDLNTKKSKNYIKKGNFKIITVKSK